MVGLQPEPIHSVPVVTRQQPHLEFLAQLTHSNIFHPARELLYPRYPSVRAQQGGIRTRAHRKRTASAGTLVTGLTAMDVVLLDVFEGTMRVQVFSLSLSNKFLISMFCWRVSRNTFAKEVCVNPLGQIDARSVPSDAGHAAGSSLPKRRWRAATSRRSFHCPCRLVNWRDPSRLGRTCGVWKTAVWRGSCGRSTSSRVNPHMNI